MAALQALNVNVYRHRIWHAVHEGAAAVAPLMALLRHTPLYRVRFRRDLSALDALADSLLAQLAA